ncbi:hypothetical protein PQU63_03710 [Xanthomonas protegens]|uniref:Uncharacterized protein n=1 Tax=Xanthomonas protegens TaxID=3380705 RepID=A0ABU9L8D9_9XANT
MNIIIGCDFKFSLDFLNSSFFAIHAISIRSGEVIEVYEATVADDFSAASAVHAIEEYKLDVQNGEEIEDFFFVLVKQLEQYKNNIYGFNLKSKFFSENSELLIFFEWYIRRFAIELMIFFSGIKPLHCDRLVEGFSQSISVADENYSESIELRKFFNDWAEIKNSLNFIN